MTDTFLKAKVDLFLKNFKECARQGKVDFSEVNVKTTRFLRSIGWTVKAMNSYVLECIESKHYFRGPSNHHRIDGRSVTEFGMVLEVEGEIYKLYVKLELIIQGEKFISGYMSFHPREKERLFLWDRLYLGMNMTEIAKKRNVSRKTVHAWRKKVQAKVSMI